MKQLWDLQFQSFVVAEIEMQNIEEQALTTYTQTIPLWLHYVDDTFTAVR